MPPWDTAMVNRLENLEEKKQKIAELEKEGNEMCESLDKLVSGNLPIDLSIDVILWVAIIFSRFATIYRL